MAVRVRRPRPFATLRFMKQLLIIIAGVAVIVSLVVFVFTFQQVRQEEASMLDDLQLRTALLADSFKESIRPSARCGVAEHPASKRMHGTPMQQN